jgi:hypothetical protein
MTMSRPELRTIGAGRFRETTAMSALAVCAVVVAVFGACSRDATRPTVSRVAETKVSESDTFTLRIVVTGSGEVTPGGLGAPCADDCTFHALRGKTVELTATGTENVFHQWSDRCGREAACKVKMASDVVIRAEFGLDRYEPAWAVPLTSSDCLKFNWLAVGEQVVVAGGFRGVATLGRVKATSSGDNDAVVVALQRGNGEVTWAQRFGGKEFDWAFTPQVLPAGDVVTGLHLSGGAPSQGGLPVQEGKIAWMNKADGRLIDSAVFSEHLAAIRRLDDGIVALVSVRGRNGRTVSKFRSTGPRSPQWTRDLTASGITSIRDLAIGPGGDVLVAGKLQGVPQFTATWKGIPRSTREWKPFFVRVDGATGVIKSARWIDWKDDRNLISMTSNGRLVILAGGVVRNRDYEAFVTALSLDGEVVWDHVYKNKHRLGGSLIHSVDASKDGIAVAGTTWGEFAAGNRRIGKSGEDTAFILEFSAKGEVLWSFSQRRDRGETIAIARDDEGDLYVTGSFQTAFDFGGQTIWPHPSRRSCSSAYVAKFARTGDRSQKHSGRQQARP